MANILFSPVGGTDPISQSNLRDGSLLHICRVYHPDRVILYMSKEVLDYQKADDRYRYCLHNLCEKEHFSMEIGEIDRPELTNVQDFNYFYDDFREILSQLFRSCSKEDRIYLNISSGTPGMKSALLVLQTLGEFNSQAIQVITPDRRMNQHDHRNYDVKLLWELNEDNQPDYENRCRIVQCPSLAVFQKEDIIKRHMLAYDYPAALAVALTLPEEKTAAYLNTLRMAAARVQLDFYETEKYRKLDPIDCIPVRDQRYRDAMEYALGLDLKARRKEYADLIRGITPLVIDLFELILKAQFDISLDQYTAETESKGRVWSEIKLMSNETGVRIRSTLENGFSAFRYGTVYSVQLALLIREFTTDPKLKDLIRDIRSVEDNIRNLAAHEIVSITEERIIEKTGFTPDQIMQILKNLFRYTPVTIRPDTWDSYDRMNQQIIDRM